MLEKVNATVPQLTVAGLRREVCFETQENFIIIVFSCMIIFCGIRRLDNRYCTVCLEKIRTCIVEYFVPSYMDYLVLTFICANADFLRSECSPVRTL